MFLDEFYLNIKCIRHSLSSYKYFIPIVMLALKNRAVKIENYEYI